MVKICFIVCVKILLIKLLYSGTLEMIYVEGGSFQMGNEEGLNVEKPVHGVSVNSYYFGKYEVTEAQYSFVTGETPRYLVSPNSAVVNVSWYEAVEFCNKLSELDSLEKCYRKSGDEIICDFNAKGYRLPTEAEWEYAARYGDEKNVYKYRNTYEEGKSHWGYKIDDYTMRVVGKDKPNKLGIYDLRGNVWEWCWDRFSFYNLTQQSNPTGPDFGQYRVIRTGEIRRKKDCDRSYLSPVGSFGLSGFRVARSR